MTDKQHAKEGENNRLEVVNLSFSLSFVHSDSSYVVTQHTKKKGERVVEKKSLSSSYVLHVVTFFSESLIIEQKKGMQLCERTVVALIALWHG